MKTWEGIDGEETWPMQLLWWSIILAAPFCLGIMAGLVLASLFPGIL